MTVHETWLPLKQMFSTAWTRSNRERSRTGESQDCSCGQEALHGLPTRSEDNHGHPECLSVLAQSMVKSPLFFLLFPNIDALFILKVCQVRHPKKILCLAISFTLKLTVSGSGGSNLGFEKQFS